MERKKENKSIKFSFHCVLEGIFQFRAAKLTGGKTELRAEVKDPKWSMETNLIIIELVPVGWEEWECFGCLLNVVG
jgi:hypothetical protein